MKIFKYFEIGVFFVLLSFMFFINDVFAEEYIKNSEIAIKNKGYYWDNNVVHGSSYTVLKKLEINPIEDPFREEFQYNGTGYYFNLPVETDYEDNYYIFGNSINMEYNLTKETSTCESNISYVLFKMEVKSAYENNEWNDMLKKSDFFQGMSAYIKQSSSMLSTTHDGYSRCTVIGSTNGTTVDVACPIKNTNITGGTLHMDFASEPWKTLTHAEGTRRPKLNATVILKDEVHIQCLDKPFLNATYIANEDSVTITVDNNDSSITEYEFYLHGQGDYIYQTSNVITYSNLSNGTYVLDYRAKYGNQMGTLNQLTIEITDSPLPVADFTLSQNGKNLIVDASSSYGIKSSIAKYYFKLDNGEWEISTNPIKTYEDLAYSNYTIYVKVEDLLGNMSSIVFKGSSVISPEEQQKTFWNYVTDFFTGFFDDLTNMFLRLFIPKTEELTQYVDILQDSLTEKLGFIGESVSFVIEEFQYFIVEPREFESICLPQTRLPDEMSGLEIIPSNTACLTREIMAHFSMITTVIKAIFSLIFIGWFVNYCYDELQKILGGSMSVEVVYK